MGSGIAHNVKNTRHSRFQSFRSSKWLVQSFCDSTVIILLYVNRKEFSWSPFPGYSHVAMYKSATGFNESQFKQQQACSCHPFLQIWHQSVKILCKMMLMTLPTRSLIPFCGEAFHKMSSSDFADCLFSFLRFQEDSQNATHPIHLVTSSTLNPLNPLDPWKKL